VRRLLVIHNPTAGRRRSAYVAAVVEALRHEGTDVTVVETGARGDAERLARTAAPEVDAVVVAGGDGTVNEVINGLLARPPSDRSLELGLIPLGTVNLLARELAIPREPAALARLLARGLAHPMHVATANGRTFALMVGAGFDARVVDRVDPRLKRRIGRWAYGWEILRQLIFHAPHRYQVRIGEAEPIDVASVVIAKGRFYGGPYELAPAASVRKGGLQVCLFERGGRLNALLYLVGLGTGRIARMPGYRVVGASAVAVTGPVDEPVQGDGDTLTRLPLSVRIGERAIAVIAP
jgi:diacylglycerol kinase (ATP)